MRNIMRACESVYTHVGPVNKCAYCGDKADTIDHTVPAHFVCGNIALIKRYKFFKVGCCFDCNVRAGGHVDLSFRERARRIAVSLRRANKRVLATAHWPEDELEALGDGMRCFVLSGVRHRAHVLLRLECLEHGTPPDLMPEEFFPPPPTAGDLLPGLEM